MDTTYCLSFFVSRADKIPYSVKNIGAYFSSTLPTMGGNQYLNYTPQIINQSGFLTDTINWVEVQGCYTALGGEQYITIGNFNSNANTDTMKTGTNNLVAPSASGYAYYYLDSITLYHNNNPTTIIEIEPKRSFNLSSLFPD